jgi:penicillin-insensitive murein endopeptidase
MKRTGSALLCVATALAGCALRSPSQPIATPSSAPVAVSSSEPAVSASAFASSEAPAASSSADAALPPAMAAENDGEIADDEGPSEGNDTSAPLPAAANPLLALSNAELAKRFRSDPSSLGSISVGAPSAGLLVNGVQMPAGDGWILQDPSHAWATSESVESLALCIEEVRKAFPSTPAIPIGHFSARGGGHLSPHKSHQSGRDVDVGYYHVGQPPRFFVPANEANLDLPRTWTLVKTALSKTTVDMIFIDVSIQKLLADFAIKSGEDPAFVDDAFQSRGKNPRAPIRHVHGHGNHLHIRFHAPVAEQLGMRLVSVLPKPDHVMSQNGTHPLSSPAAPTGAYEQIRARSGDTLVVWAKRYGTTVAEIQRANGLSGTALRIGVVYRIPTKVTASAAPNDKKTSKKRPTAKVM